MIGEITCRRLAAALLALSPNAAHLAAAAAWCTPGRPMQFSVFGVDPTHPVMAQLSQRTPNR